MARKMSKGRLFSAGFATCGPKYPAIERKESQRYTGSILATAAARSFRRSGCWKSSYPIGRSAGLCCLVWPHPPRIPTALRFRASGCLWQQGICAWILCATIALRYLTIQKLRGSISEGHYQEQRQTHLHNAWSGTRKSHTRRSPSLSSPSQRKHSLPLTGQKSYVRAISRVSVVRGTITGMVPSLVARYMRQQTSIGCDRAKRKDV